MIKKIMFVCVLCVGFLLIIPDDTKKEDPILVSNVDTIVKSIQSKSSLLVLTSKLVSTPTSSYKKLGFTAEQTNIILADANYYIDLSKLSKNDIIETDTNIEITVPRPRISLSNPNFNGPIVYTNGSVLFSVSDASNILSGRNIILAKNDILLQSKLNINIAEDEGSKSIKKLINVINPNINVEVLYK